ncbi:MAG: glycosyltransferase family 2 protein [Nitrospirae bacterium]|nr:glycosyltransferase family 2 protein [Magnetococcales bacterium]
MIFFSIIIPAFNEEQAIEQIIVRCLGVRAELIAQTAIDEVEIIVVSDGSTDQTEEIALRFESDLRVIAYPHNKGYGYALKTGFAVAKGDIVAFLDADGTCDPRFFIPMVQKLERSQADICIGSRMGTGSEMPRLRRIGNLFFRYLINVLGNTSITDAASGMRVIRRSALKWLYPLPDGLHFTPAMSCTAVMDAHLEIVEIEMTYEERLGRSKLKVLQDGIGFLKVILSIALMYRPIRVFGVLGVLMSAIAFWFGLLTLSGYLRQEAAAVDFHRVFSVVLFGITGIFVTGMSVVADRAAKLIHRLPRHRSPFGRLLHRSFRSRPAVIFSSLCVLSGVAMNLNNIVSWFTTGQMHSHWAYLVTGGFLWLLGAMILAIALINHMFDLIELKLEYRDAMEIGGRTQDATPETRQIH